MYFGGGVSQVQNCIDSFSICSILFVQYVVLSLYVLWKHWLIILTDRLPILTLLKKRVYCVESRWLLHDVGSQDIFRFMIGSWFTIVMWTLLDTWVCQWCKNTRIRMLDPSKDAFIHIIYINIYAQVLSVFPMTQVVHLPDTEANNEVGLTEAFPDSLAPSPPSCPTVSGFGRSRSRGGCARFVRYLEVFKDTGSRCWVEQCRTGNWQSLGPLRRGSASRSYEP